MAHLFGDVLIILVCSLINFPVPSQRTKGLLILHAALVIEVCVRGWTTVGKNGSKSLTNDMPWRSLLGSPGALDAFGGGAGTRFG